MVTVKCEPDNEFPITYMFADELCVDQTCLRGDFTSCTHSKAEIQIIKISKVEYDNGKREKAAAKTFRQWQSVKHKTEL